jgi:alginate O-acetyltransferase complex protein AlgI
MALWWSALASLAFYAVGDPRFLPLLLGSVVVNYFVGNQIVKITAQPSDKSSRTLWLIAGVTINLAALGYFKYANFFLDNIAMATGWTASVHRIVLPIGISFFTFTQIAFLVDCQRGEARHYRFVDYLLFVTFFPHLVAGPILNHKSIVPQLESREFGRPTSSAIYAGFLFFSIGLFKKIAIADSLAPLVQPVFSNITHLGMIEAWTGALLYTFQLYYDFSGYSEMAVGLAFLMNVRIPINFDSPYKATSIIDFWRRWHISLSNFLRDYLYIPLGGNRRGETRRYVNILITMLLGGLWHGAGWTFAAWGALHGASLAMNHMWRATKLRLPSVVAWLLTFVVVVIGWVFFRAPDISSAVHMLATMAGLHGQPSWESIAVFFRFGQTASHVLPDPLTAMGWIAVLSIWVIIAPNTQDLVLTPRPRPALAAGAAVIFVGAVLNLDRVSEFLYFQF